VARRPVADHAQHRGGGAEPGLDRASPRACGYHSQREARAVPTRPGRRRQRAARVSRPARTSGGSPGRMARLVDEAGGYLVTWAVALALVFGAGIAFAWRAHALAQGTHDI